MAKPVYDNCNKGKGFGTTLDKAFSFSKCPLLSIVVPKSKQLTMCRVLKPFLKHFNALENAFEVLEKEQSLTTISVDGAKLRIPPYSVSQEQMSSPAVSIMLFLPEFGPGRAEKVKLKFRKPPWHLHHSIQLQKHNSSDVLGMQEFYFLSRGYPLWNVSTAPRLSRQLRINIFVRRYSAMVEFYRLVTGSEMESSKPGFCVFKLNTQIYSDNDGSAAAKGDAINMTSSFPSQKQNSRTKTDGDENSDTNNVTFELALKHCPHINPFAITDAYLTFPVSNITPLRTVIHNYIRPLTSTRYLVHDPDGNPVILYDTSVVQNHSTQHTRYLVNDSSTPIGNSPSSPSSSSSCSSSSSLSSELSSSTLSSSISAILAASASKRSFGVDKDSIRSDNNSLDSGRFSDFETSCSATELDQYMAKIFPCYKNDDKNDGNDDDNDNNIFPELSENDIDNFYDYWAVCDENNDDHHHYHGDVVDKKSICNDIRGFPSSSCCNYEEKKPQSHRVSIGNILLLQNKKKSTDVYKQVTRKKKSAVI